MFKIGNKRFCRVCAVYIICRVEGIRDPCRMFIQNILGPLLVRGGSKFFSAIFLIIMKRGHVLFVCIERIAFSGGGKWNQQISEWVSSRYKIIQFKIHLKILSLAQTTPGGSASFKINKFLSKVYLLIVT